MSLNVLALEIKSLSIYSTHSVVQLLMRIQNVNRVASGNEDEEEEETLFKFLSVKRVLIG